MAKGLEQSYGFNKNEIKDSPYDWKEDFKHENGNYMNTCLACGTSFLGHKRRMYCKKCSNKKK